MNVYSRPNPNTTFNDPLEFSLSRIYNAIYWSACSLDGYVIDFQLAMPCHGRNRYNDTIIRNYICSF